MECDICGQEVDNSEDLARHLERLHPTYEGNKPVENGEKPDFVTRPESESIEAPETAQTRR